jgi:tetratricopeptide (TPR) repeat protein
MSLSYTRENRKYPGALLFAACFFASLPMLGQSAPGGGQISGTVAGPNSSPLVGAQVVLQSSAGSAEQKRIETDKTGRYSFSGLSLGAYKLSASASGFQDSETKVVILTSANATVDLTLTPLESPRADSKADSASQKSPPVFSPAGVRGTIAPGGYSTGLSNEETAHVSASANALEPTLFRKLIDVAPIDCSQESVLLRDVEKAPHDFARNHALGVFYLSHGDYSKGIQYFGVAHSLVPGDFANSRDLTVAMIASGRGSDAVALLEQLLLDHESDSTLLRLLAFAYRSAGDNEKSVTAFHKAAASDAGVDNQYDCGIGLIQLGALMQALDLFTGATKTHSESPRLWLGLGITEHLLDHKPEAVSALLRSADADPDFFPPLALLADLSSLSDPTKAGLRRGIAAYLVAHPGDAEAHLAYALVLSKQSQPEETGNSREETASQLKRALQLNPRMARAHFLLGDMEADANNLSGAIDEFVEAVKLEPGNAQAHYRLSLLYRRNGQQEAARREMDAFLALHGKPGEEDFADASGTLSLTLPSIQPVPAQSPCGLKPQ